MSDIEGALPYTHCLNCDTALHGHYCASCGQRAVALNPSLHDVVHDATHEFLHVDGKIFRSVWLLLTAPGVLTREYVEGRRQRHVTPIRLYLLFSVLYFAAMALAPGVGFSIDFAPDADATAEQQRWFEERLPDAQRITGEIFSHWVPRAMFVLVPVFAALVGLTTRGRGRHYPQHLYFALHLHAAWFIAGAVYAVARLRPVTGLTTMVGLAAVLYVVGYFWLAFRRVYEYPPGGTTWRVLVVGGTYLVLLGALLVAFLMLVIRTAFASGTPVAH